jgi:hypothetical protein
MFPEKIAHLKSALDKLDGPFDRALAREERMRAFAKGHGIDPDDVADIQAHMRSAMAASDDNSVKTLRAALDATNTASDALTSCCIEIEAANDRMKAFDSMPQLKTVDGDDGVEAGKAVATGWDFAVQSVKAIIDVVTGNEGGATQAARNLALAAGLLEIANSDAFKSGIEKAVDQLAKKVDDVRQSLNDSVSALNSLAGDLAKAEKDRAGALSKLFVSESTHYQTAMRNFLHDLRTLPPAKGGAPTVDRKSIFEVYDAVVKTNDEMDAVAKVRGANQSILADASTRSAFVPIGVYNDTKSTTLSHFQLKQVQGADQAHVFDKAGRSWNFFTKGIDRGGLEAMAGAFARVLEQLPKIPPAAKRLADLRQKWDNAIAEGLTPEDNPNASDDTVL